MTSKDLVSSLSNEALLAETARLASRERGATADLIRALAEVEARRLYLGESCSSMYSYCTRVLHLSEHAAYGRIEAARAARRFPVILEMLADASLTLTSVGLLARSLTPENYLEVLAAARHKSTREVEHQAAALRPQPAVPASVRKLPQPRIVAPSSARSSPAMPFEVPAYDTTQAAPFSTPLPHRRAAVKPLAPEQYKVQFTVGRETHDKLRRAQDLLRHVLPNGDVAALFDRAITLLIEQLEKRKLGAAEHPRGDRVADSQSRFVPASVRRAVWERDGGRCAFIGGEYRWHGERARIQPTLGSLVRMMLVSHGRVPTPDAIRRYQSEHFGSAKGETVIAELMPLPSRSITDWIYSATGVPGLETREAYLRTYRPMRVKLLREARRRVSRS